MDNTEEYNFDLFKQLMDNGYTATKAKDAVLKRNKNKDQINKIRNTVEILKYIPIRFLNLPNTNFEKQEYLWKMGYNTKSKGWAVDTCCYNWNGTLECGEIVIGEERVDKEWTTKRIEGRLVASDEAVDKRREKFYK